jgi:hypothetical protein
MVCLISNDNKPLLRAPFTVASNDGLPSSKTKVDFSTPRLERRPVHRALNVKPEDFIAFQMSSIPEVEQVYVSGQDGITLNVLTIVDKRDRDLNRRIYAKEAEIMDFYSHLQFDFHILPRMGRDLKEIISASGFPVL